MIADARRLRVLASAYACNPSGSAKLHPGEDLTGWRLTEQLARGRDLWVITHAYNRPGVEDGLKGRPDPGIRFHFIELPKALKGLYRIEFGQRIYYFLWQIKAWRLARRLHREVGFDIAHHVTFGNDWIASFIGAFLPVPFVWGPVGGGQRTPRPLLSEYTAYGRFAEAARNAAQWFGRRMLVRRLCLKRARAMLVCNEETRALVPDRFRGKVIFFPVNGISREDILPGARPLRKGPSFRVMTAGRLHRLKGFAIAVKAFARLAERHPDAELLIVGKGPEEAALRELIGRLGLALSVTLQDWLPRREVLERMRTSDVFLFPSFRDGGGAVVVEAMASGLPVVCLDSGGPGSHIRPEWGIKIRPGASDEVVREMGDALISLYEDRPRGRALGEAALRRAREFYPWESLGNRIGAIYEAVLRGTYPADGEGR